MSKLLLVIGVLSSLICTTFARNIEVDVTAPWKRYSTSVVAEIAEFIGEESNDMFWKYVDGMCSESERVEFALQEGSREQGTDLQSVAYEVGSAVIPPSLHSLMDTTFGLGGNFPAVRFYESLSESYNNPCNNSAFIVAYPSKSILCSSEEVVEYFQSNAIFSEEGTDSSDWLFHPQMDSDWDHIHPLSLTATVSNGAVRSAILYGSIGTSKFCSLHSSLSKLTETKSANPVRYAVRHAFHGYEVISTDSRVQGYGIFLDIKNVEYKTFDDSKDNIATSVTAAKDSDKVSFVEGEEIAGVVFSTVAKRRPDAVEALSVLRAELTNKIVEEGSEMKLWKIKELGQQLVTVLVSSPSPVDKLSDIVQNFPLHATSLTSVKVSDAVRNAFSADSPLHRGMLNSGLVSNSLYINGIRFDLSGAAFNVYDVLAQVRKEIGSLHQLNLMNVSSSLKTGLRQAAVALSSNSAAAANGQQSLSSIIRIDISKGGKFGVTFFNNLEKDTQYKRWPKKLKTLLMPSWQLQAVARNLYTLVVVADPLSLSGAYLLQQLQMIYQQQYPVRIGAVLSCQDDSSNFRLDSTAAATSANARLCRLFSHVKETYGLIEASTFLFHVALTVLEIEQQQQMPQSADVIKREELYSVDMLTDTYVAAINSMESVFESTSKLRSDAKRIQLGETSKGVLTYPYSDFVANTTAYIQARGLPINSFSLNGIVIKDSDMNQHLMQLLGREQYIISQAVRMGTITDKTSSIFTAILDQNGMKNTFSRYHPILEPTTEAEYVDISQTSFRTLLKKINFHYAIDVQSAVEQINSVIIVTPFTEFALQSAVETLRWAVSSSAINSHRIGFVNLLSEEELVCIENMLGQVTVAGSTGVGANWVPPETCRLLTSWQSLQQLIELQLGLSVPSTDSDFAFSDVASKVIGAFASSDSAAHTFKSSMLYSSLQSNPSAVQKVLNSFRSTHKAAKIASSNPNAIVVFYNTRRIELEADSALYENDLSLFASLEFDRFGSNLKAAIDQSPSSATANTVQDKADNFLMLSSFVGIYGGKKGVNRIDIKQGLEEINVQLSSTKKSSKRKKRSLSSAKSEASATGATATAGSSSVIGVLGSTGTYSLTVPPSIDTPFSNELSIAYFIDPLSVAGQRAVSLIKLFSNSLNLVQQVILAPQRELSEFPLQNFYRFVLTPHAATTITPGLTSAVGASAYFRALPKQHTLTVRVDGPEPWNIQAQSATQDIDNLVCKANSGSSAELCGDITSTGVQTDLTSVSYRLKNILFTGSCVQTVYQQMHHVPPNGLQLTFTRFAYTDSSTDDDRSKSLGAGGGIELKETTDTLVMQNLGYYQLQANPGLWHLNLATGRAQQLYSLDADDASNADATIDEVQSVVVDETGQVVPQAESSSRSKQTKSTGKIIAVKSFSDVFHRLIVHKRAGKEQIPLLQDSDSGSGDDNDGLTNSYGDVVNGMWESITSIFGGSNNNNNPVKDSNKKANSRALTAEDETVHVFSLATGHMYERLLRIMMLSVTKRTSVKVKFWLLENYLSPTFKQIVDLMSETYGFEVGYVTYKWPEWLRQQTQKQRIIWGYKILFLDVLFPLHVKKVIYVDADQVLRADLKELWDEDLHGKPYAYTPFCTSREETLGFQFWRSGYWAEHLRGKPYHISALYVVDLQKFRRNAVGDQLRAVYDGLARDPNSLANLDQDLPNYAQHSVPIHSLPQSWLWCETWCSDDSKKEAKTIDLCNNPLHKEPKLDMARRVISGSLFNESWIDLDGEIRQLEIRGGFRAQE